MSTILTVPERIASPLASNNPFRHKVGSGSGSTSPSDAPGAARPASRNPFLDSSEVTTQPAQLAATNPTSPKSGATGKATELLADLTLNGKRQSPSRGPRPPMNGDARCENMPPRPYGRGPPPGHRSSMTEEERKRRETRIREKVQNGELLDIFADPPDANRIREKRPPRRNSESSVRDKPAVDPEEEKKRRERKNRESKRPGKDKKSSRRLDVIDKLDVTSIYGTGLFHHDGPFDACNPHRNRKGSRQAPMQAFPEGSLNMQIGGSGPVNKNIDLNQYHGIGQEAHIDYSRAAAVDADAAYVNRPTRELGRDGGFNTTARVEPVHGSESVGLGTSTFLEGAPASRAAIARRESENEAAQQVQSLSRKKSVAQRIRTMRSNTITNRDRTISPDGSGTPITPLETTRSESNVNPFFKDYDQEYEKKGQQIAIAEAQEKRSVELPGRARAPSSPRRGLGLGLERMKTADSIGGGEDGVGKPESKATGILNRMKSLKGGRRARPERRDTSG